MFVRLHACAACACGHSPTGVALCLVTGLGDVDPNLPEPDYDAAVPDIALSALPIIEGYLLKKGAVQSLCSCACVVAGAGDP